jgi:hypothetical protein
VDFVESNVIQTHSYVMTRTATESGFHAAKKSQHLLRPMFDTLAVLCAAPTSNQSLPFDE